jgi:hypothetical protein
LRLGLGLGVRLGLGLGLQLRLGLWSGLELAVRALERLACVEDQQYAQCGAIPLH